MTTYVPPMRPLGYTHDKQGHKLSFRQPDGTGWDRTYDAQGRPQRFRRTNGTGWVYHYRKGLL